MDKYMILGAIGEGAHGIVSKAKSIQSGEEVALKKVPLKRIDDSIPNTALREIKALQEIGEHQNIVTLRDVFPHGTGFVLVFEFMLSDLSEVIRNVDRPITESQVKSYMRMLLKGVNFCHENNIIHRDLKPANLLISSTGHLKIADFGQARIFTKSCQDEESGNERQFSHQVATRWYRSPELLYGAKKYDEGVDLWAVGCIFGELLNMSPVFPGDKDIDQLACVLRFLGTPTEESWPGMSSLPDYSKIIFPPYPPTPFESVFPDASPMALHLVKSFLIYDSCKRVAAAEALLHPYFFSPPLPAHHSELPIPVTHRLANKKMRQPCDLDLSHPISHSLVHPTQLDMFA